MKKLVQRIKQFRLVGYITIGLQMNKIKPLEETIPTMFLLIVLTELSIYKGK